MRMSQLFGRTLRDAPAGSEVAGHQLLLRAGALRQLTQGVFSYLPVGLRVLRRIEGIVREEMEAAGGVEVSLPVVHPAELWRASGRLTSTGPELTRFEDRRQHGLVLAMTHEEVVAALAASEVHSWRDLP
ncbi:MAG: proline--tRNA ligase, partial [Acidimicrobiales bacterium]